MSENLERVQLNENEEELVVGGTLIYRSRGDCYHVWSDENPGVEYGIPYGQVIAAKMYEARDLAGKSDAEKLATMLAEGYIFQL